MSRIKVFLLGLLLVPALTLGQTYDSETGSLLTKNPFAFKDDEAFTLTTSFAAVMGAIRDDSLSALSAIEGDVVPLRVNSTGALWVTGGGGGTEYTEDAAAPADPIGGVQQLVRLDTPATLTTADNDIVSRRGTNYGAAYSQIVTSSGSFVDTFGGGTQYTEGAVDATITGTVALGEAPSNTIEVLQLDASKLLQIDIAADSASLATSAGQLADGHNVTVDNAGAGAAVNIQDGGNTITVDGTVAATQSGTWNINDIAGTVSLPTGAATAANQSTVITSVQKIDNIAHAGSDVALVEHVPQSAQLDDAATTAVTENQIAPLRLTPERSMHIELRSGANETGVVGSAIVVGDGAGAFNVDVDSSALPTGAATSANQLADGHNVTVDNAAGGAAVNIQDGGNSVTVDAPVATPANVQISDGTDTALVSGAGALVVDGSAVTQPVSGTITANAGTGDFLTVVGHTRNEAFKESAAIGGELDDAATTAATEGNVSPVRITAQRSLHTTIRDSAGDSAMDDANDALQVNVVAGAAGGTEYTEDDAAPANPAGGVQQLVRLDTPATLTTTDNDIVARRATNYGAAYTQIVTSAGAFVDTFGGGTQYTEDVASPADPVGGATLLRRRDTPASESTTAGDWVAGNATDFGAQFVQVVSSSGAFIDSFGGSGGTAQADRSTFTDGTTNFTPIGGTFNETNTNPTEDQAAAARITQERALHVNIRDSTADTGATVGANGLEVDVQASVLPTGAATSALQLAAGHDVTVDNAGAGAAVNIQDGGNVLTIDGSSSDDTANSTTKVPVIVARANAVSPTFSEGNMVPLSTDLSGLLRTSIPALSTTGALGALNATVETSMLGQGSAGFTLAAGTLDGTLVPEISNDGGTNWVATFFADPATRQKIGSIVVTNPNPVTVRSVLVSAGATDARVRVSVYNSGTANATVSTTTANDPTITFDNPTGVATAPTFVQMAGTDGTNTVGLSVDGGVEATALRVTLANDSTGLLTVEGGKSNNGGVPGTTNLGTLPAVANAAAPTHTETNQVALRTQLDGDLVVEMEDALPAGDNNVGNVDIVTFPDNEPIDVAQMNGVAVTMGNGVSGTGVQRVTIASDSTGQVTANAGTNLNTSALLTTSAHDAAFGTAGAADAQVRTVQGIASGTPVIVGDGAGALNVIVDSITAGDTNIGNVDIVTLPDEGQQTAANSISVTPDTDNDAIGATGAAPPGEAVLVGGLASGATGGFLTAPPVCDSFEPVDIVTATTTLEITGVSARHVYICAINLVTAAANNVAIIAGTGATCGTGTAGMNGGTTAAEGWNFAANGGIAQGSGFGAIMRTTDAGDSVCIITSAATQLSGTISYTIY